MVGGGGTICGSAISYTFFSLGFLRLAAGEACLELNASMRPAAPLPYFCPVCGLVRAAIWA